MSGQLLILDLHGKRYNLDIDENNTVRDVKIKIRDLDGPHPNSQKIIYRGKELNDNENITYYINYEFENSKIKHMILDKTQTTNFKVRLEDGQILDINYNIKKEGNTILDFKVHLLRILYIITSNMILTINGTLLENNQKITFLDITDNFIDLQIIK